MTREHLRHLFPFASNDFLDNNADAIIARSNATEVERGNGSARGASAGILERKKGNPADSMKEPLNVQWIEKNSCLELFISGQVRGGKNNMVVTRSGLHFPKKEWAKWRDEKVAEVKSSFP